MGRMTRAKCLGGRENLLIICNLHTQTSKLPGLPMGVPILLILALSARHANILQLFPTASSSDQYMHVVRSQMQTQVSDT